MSPDTNAIVKAIVSLNNSYRNRLTSTQMKLEALWEIGDQLIKMGVTSPHSVGWSVQRETGGLIKRPTIFRSHKIRTIWSSKNEMVMDVGLIRGLSNLTEILPLIDPAQNVRRQLSSKQINEIYRHACSDAPQQFKRYIAELKKKFSHGRLGKPLDKSKHLDHLESVVSTFRALLTYLSMIINQEASAERSLFRASTSRAEMRAFSNMCIALTTKDNFRLYKRLGPPTSTSRNLQFQTLYAYFYKMLDNRADVERARLRRLIPAEALAQMSDIVSSLNSETGVKDYAARQKIAINL
jgi:hypothetical protein